MMDQEHLIMEIWFEREIIKRKKNKFDRIQTPRHDGSMTPHAHGGASAWDPTYATTPRLVFILLLL